MSEETVPYFQRMQQIKLGLLPKEAVPKPKKRLRNKSLKTQAQEAEQKKANSIEGKEESLNQWFERIAQKHLVNGYAICQECGSLIPAEYMRHATAHLLPKKLFKSIATNELNYLILGAGCGCHEKSHRIDKFVQMKVWPEAARRINALLPLVTHDELRFISAQLYTELENY